MTNESKLIITATQHAQRVRAGLKWLLEQHDRPIELERASVDHHIITKNPKSVITVT